MSFDYKIVVDDVCADENLAESDKTKNINDKKVDAKKSTTTNDEVVREQRRTKKLQSL